MFFKISLNPKPTARYQNYQGLGESSERHKYVRLRRIPGCLRMEATLGVDVQGPGTTKAFQK